MTINNYKTADEKLEEIGFIKHEGYHSISYNHCINNEINTEIIFHKFHKEYEFENLDIAFDVKLHLAIHQKLIELGWLNEDMKIISDLLAGKTDKEELI